MQSASPPPIYAFSPYGLANRLLGLASTLYVCDALRRPLVLIWEQNECIGNANFNELFENEFTIISRKPSDIPILRGDRELTADSFPVDTPIILDCHDVCKFPGLNDPALRSGLQTLRLVPSILNRVAEFTASHDIANFIGIHIRQGDKWRAFRSRHYSSMALRAKVESQYDVAFQEIIQRTDANIYLSCDDPAAWRKYKRLYRDRVHCAPKTRNPLQRDGDSIAEALLDLYLLSRTRFMLYGIGTFGYAAHILGGSLGRNILYSKEDFFILFRTLLSIPSDSFPDVRDIIESASADSSCSTAVKPSPT